MRALWTDARERQLVELYNAGMTFAQIVDALGGGITRSMVAGKLSRLGCKRGLVAAPAGSVEKVPQPARPRPPRPKVARNFAVQSAKVAAFTAATPEIAQQRRADYEASPARKHAFDPDHAPSGARKVSLENLKRAECKWPLYEDGPMIFCGATVGTFDINGQPSVYCTVHGRMAGWRL